VRGGVKRPALFAVLLLLFLFEFLFFGIEESFGRDELFQEDEPVEIKADTITHDKTMSTLYASGNVTVTQGGVSISADSVVYDGGLGIVTAEGTIEGNDEGGNLLSGDTFRFDVKRKTAVIVNGRLFFKGENVYLNGDRMKKTGRETYEIEGGTFTTCDCNEGETPPWSITSKKADVTVGSFLKAWHNFFKIKGTPVLYFPYFSAPIKRERQTGFLAPRLGYSSMKGASVYNSFYWAMSRSTDATFFLDIESSRGGGGGLEYRYIRRRGSQGTFNFSYFRERDIDRVRSFRADEQNLSRPETAKEGRWLLEYSHEEKAPFGFVFRADLKMVSDDEYFLDFGKGDERSLESLETTISLSKNWHDYNLVVEFRIFDNLLVGDDSETLQRLPQITFSRAGSRLLRVVPLYLALESTFVNFERESGIEGQRLDFRPRFSLPFNPGGYLEITPSIAPRATLYWDKNNVEGRFQDRYIYDVTVNAATTFVNVLSYSNNGGGLEKVRHTIRPGLTYTYIPEVIQDDSPSFDASDRIERKSELSYSLNSILTGRFREGDKARYRDFIYLNFSQSYSVVEAARTIIVPGDKRRPFSALSGEVILDPSEAFTLAAKGSYDVYDRVMAEYDVSMAMRDRRGDRVDINYRFINNTNEFLDFSTGVKATAAIDLFYRNRFSLFSNKSIETNYSAEYRHQCWNSRLTYTRRLDENIVLLTFDLLGIGRVGGISSAFGGD